MAGGQFSTAKLYGMTIRESATDGSDFTNPDADYRRLFLGEDGLLHVKDSAGTVSDPYTGASGIDSGTSFPGTPSNNDIFYRTDRDLLYFYDGTRWLTANLYDLPIPPTDAALPFSATSACRVTSPHAAVYDLWLEDFQSAFHVVAGTALSASHKWVITLVKSPAESTIATITIDSGSLNAWRDSGQIAIDALLGTTQFALSAVATKTGTPGNLFTMPTLTYRMVG